VRLTSICCRKTSRGRNSTGAVVARPALFTSAAIPVPPTASATCHVGSHTGFDIGRLSMPQRKRAEAASHSAAQHNLAGLGKLIKP